MSGATTTQISGSDERDELGAAGAGSGGGEGDTDGARFTRCHADAAGLLLDLLPTWLRGRACDVDEET